MNYFQRYYLYIILKSIGRYYSLNNNNNKFPDLNYKSIFNYYNIIVNFIVKNEIIPNQEIISFFIEFSKQKENQKFNIIGDIIEPKDIKLDNKIFSKDGNILNIKYKEKELKAKNIGPIDNYKIIKNLYNSYNFNINNLKSEDIIEIIINIIDYIINDKEDNKSNIIHLLLESIIIIINTFHIDINKYNKKIIEKSIYKMNKLLKYLSF